MTCLSRALRAGAALVTAAVISLGLPQGAHAAQSAGSMTAPPMESAGGNVRRLAASLQGKPVLAQIHADWCPVCRAETPTLAALRRQYGSRIAFVELDVTNGRTAAAAAAKAKSVGLGRFFEANKATTGTVAVINPRTGDVAATLYNVTNPTPYAKAIDVVAKALHS